ncbi:hypothetical protein FRB90_012625 [Tulasnella sp. 427]|nr:hypothetical protein FRB90_012625 [Tulasnella sp. 427]
MQDLIENPDEKATSSSTATCNSSTTPLTNSRNTSPALAPRAADNGSTSTPGSSACPALGLDKVGYRVLQCTSVGPLEGKFENDEED